MKRKILLPGLCLLLLAPLGLLGLMDTATGSRWLLPLILQNVPAQISCKTIEGKLLQEFVLSDINYQSDTLTVKIDSLEFAWQPAKLLNGILHISTLKLHNVSINVLQNSSTNTTPSFDVNAPLTLPVELVLQQLQVTELSVQQGEQIQNLQAIQLAATSENGQLNLKSLLVNAEPLVANATGFVLLGNGFPLNITAAWQLKTADYGLWQGNTHISGSLQQLKIVHQHTSPFTLQVQGDMADVLQTPRLNIQGKWQNLQWPLNNTPPQVSSPTGAFTLTGLLNNYQLKLHAALKQANLPLAQINSEVSGNTEAISITQLALSSAAGALQLNGSVSWKDNTAFDLSATAQNFNPGLLIPEIPGKLSFDMHLQGKLSNAGVELDATINKLFGKLRGYPLSANGKLFLAQEQLRVEAFNIVAGKNTLAVSGALDQQQSTLNFVLAAPALETVWPGLTGSIQSNGSLHGSWQNPALKLQAKAKRLQFAAYRLGQLALDVDYPADPKHTAHLQLDASELHTDELDIAKLQVAGSGTRQQHSIAAKVISNVTNVASSLTGSYNAGVWQGNLAQLDLTGKRFGSWKLQDKLLLSVAHKPTEALLTLGKNCLVQQTASLCSQGNYATADRDFQLQLNANKLPASLWQSFLPANTNITGFINADVDLHQQQGLLSGSYRLALPNATQIKYQTGVQGHSELTLGASSIAGKVQDSKFDLDADIVLLEHDYLKAQLIYDAHKMLLQAGHINTSMQNLSLLQPFIPQITTLAGNLQADLELHGKLQQPVLQGTLGLQQGAITLAESGLGLRDINLQAVASGKDIIALQLQGSATPILAQTSDSQVQLHTSLNFSADLQQGEQLSGQYQVNMPTNTSISLKTDTANTEVKLGASSLTGNIEGKHISANLNLALVGQDSLRTQLQFDLGVAQTLTGSLNASVTDFTPLQPFIPQLANPKGKLSAALTCSGSLAQPNINGELSLNAGKVELPELGIILQEIKLQAHATENAERAIQFNGSAKAGQGSIQITGFVDVHGTGQLSLQGTDFEVLKQPESEATITPDLQLAFTRQHAQLTGRIKIPQANIKLPEIPENAIKVSKDEIIVGETTPANQTTPDLNFDADIDIELGKNISFSGQGLQTKLSGALKIRKTAENIASYGNITMDKARYKSYGQDLNVRKGRFEFNGPVDNPWLNLEAIRVSKSQDVTAILTISGPLDKLQTQITSEPALPESEAFAYLVTGSPLSQVSKSDSNMLASAALSYGAKQLSWVADKLGVSELDVKEGKTLQDTLLTVGQYLTPDFYIGSKVGLFNKQAVLVLKRKLTKNINLETQAGTSQRVKLNYEFDTE